MRVNDYNIINAASRPGVNEFDDNNKPPANPNCISSSHYLLFFHKNVTSPNDQKVRTSSTHSWVPTFI